MKAHLILATCILGAGSSAFAAAFSLTSAGVPNTENFNTLVSSGTGSALPAGWELSESGLNQNTAYSAGTGSSNAGDTYSFGASGSGERALGGLRSGNLVPLFGFGFTNNTGSVLTSLDLAYTGEMWRLGATSTARPALDRLDFQYSLDANSIISGTWTDFDALDFVTPDNAGSAGGRDGNVAPNRSLLASSITGLSIQPGSTVWLRWSDLDVTGSDDGLAVDDFSLTARAATVTTPEAGLGLVLSGVVMLGMMFVAQFLRRRLPQQPMIPCRIQTGPSKPLR